MTMYEGDTPTVLQNRNGRDNCCLHAALRIQQLYYPIWKLSLTIAAQPPEIAQPILCVLQCIPSASQK